MLAVSAEEFARIGVMQYEHTLPLADREVVLTFDRPTLIRCSPRNA